MTMNFGRFFKIAADKNRIVVLALILVTVTTSSVGIAQFMLYQKHLVDERAHLLATAQSQARIIESIARFDIEHAASFPDQHPEGSRPGTLSQIIRAHEDYKGFGKTGEFTMAEHQGDLIVFTFRHRLGGVDLPAPVPFDSELAEPMRRALLGISGTMIGPDYRGVTVLAAHEPVAVLNMGIVAKNDLREIQAYFIRTSTIAGAIMIVLILVGLILFYNVSNPLMEHLTSSKEKLEAEVLVRRQAEETLLVQAARIQLLFAAGKRLGLSLNLDDIYRTVYKVISQTVTCDGLVVSSYSREDELIRCVACYHEGNPVDVADFPPIPLEPEGQGTQSVAIRTGESLLLADYQQDRRTVQTAYFVSKKGIVNHDQAPADEEVTHSALIVPLKSESQVIGVVQVFSYQINSFSEEDLALLDALAPQIAAAMINARLYQQSQTEITQRQQAEKELEEQQDQLEIMVDQRTQELEVRVAEVETLNRGMISLAEDMQVINSTLELRTSELSELNQELESFSYSVSHDLRAPLRAIDGFTKILTEDYAGTFDVEGQRLLQVITDNAQKMGKLIDDILALSRLGRKAMKFQTIDTNKLVREIRDNLMAEAAGRTIRWQIKKLPNIRADLALIRQVFINLQSNAVKFTSTRETTRIEIGSKTQDGQLVFYVKDNGVGFDMQYVDKIFEVFQRLHSSKEFKGTGVGLAIVKRLVQRHGGRTWAEAKVGKGTTVFITLPQKG